MRPNKETHMHVFKAFVNIRQSGGMSDIFVNFNFTGEVIYESKKKVSSKNLDEWRNVPSTRPGISVLPLTPPNALPRHVRPVTSWNLQRGQHFDADP